METAEWNNSTTITNLHSNSNNSINSNPISNHQINCNLTNSVKSRELINKNHQINSNQTAITNQLISNNSKLINNSHHLITRDPQFITTQDNSLLGFMTCQRNSNKQLASINRLNEEKQLIEDMKHALNSSSNINDFENRLKQLRTASLSRSVVNKRFNRLADTMIRSNHQFKNEQQFHKMMPQSNEHIYESIETNQLNNHLNNQLNNQLNQEYYFNSKLNAYTQQHNNNESLIQTVNDDDWSCSSYSTMNGIYDEKPLLLNRNSQSRQATNEDYDDQLRQKFVDQQDELPDLLLKFKNESYS